MNAATIIWRTATASDVEIVHKFTRDAYKKWVSVIGREPLPMAADYDKAVLEHRIDLFYQGDELVALIELIPKEDHLMIENLCVLPKHQRRGLGKKLLIHAEEVAKNLTLETLKLDTNKLFSGNVELYERTGYEIVWEKPIDHGIHVHMEKTLTRALSPNFKDA